MSQSTIGNADTGEEEHPWPHIESMFTLVKVRNSSYILRCLLCLPKQTDISAFKNSTSNLRKHVARVHPNKLSKYTDFIENHRKRKSSSSSDTSVKNAKITAFSAPGRVTQATLDKMVLNFVWESSVHMGLLLPTLYQLRDKLKRLESSCKMCTSLVHTLKQGIQKRFGDVMKEPELIAAAILLPRFRTSWTTEENIVNTGLDYIRNHLDTDLDDITSTNSSLSDEDDFFASMELGKSQVGELERAFLATVEKIIVNCSVAKLVFFSSLNEDHRNESIMF
ncbi:hypothetical protein DPX16_20681 [Anabarilius grahami]|uniref:BED-type domain-containing protein n=1 Tax=Anabarilius grahami TaxID=495550 RepID=A0A3N0YLG7_ANAGA|nr:hypothetical protein DPX16_20681 [Anabarilius grahami]